MKRGEEYREYSKYTSNTGIKISWVRCGAVWWGQLQTACKSFRITDKAVEFESSLWITESSIWYRQYPGNRITSELTGLRHILWKFASLCAFIFYMMTSTLNLNNGCEDLCILKFPSVCKIHRKYSIFNKFKCPLGSTAHGSQNCEGWGCKCKGLF